MINSQIAFNVNPMVFADRIDWTLLTLWLALVSFGLVMIASASITFAEATYNGDAWFFVKRHLLWLGMGVVTAILVGFVPTVFWRKYGGWLLLLAIALLVMVLIPGVGRRVNGAQRWLQLGPFSFQASEVVKFCSIIFFASYISRRVDELRQTWKGFLKPIGVAGLLAIMLLLEPDFGSTVVLLTTVVAMLFIAGIKLGHFFVLLIVGSSVLWKLVTGSDYRLQRLITFLDPWADPYVSGYQLTQSLIAFGRGEWFGLGLGNSVQKLLYLPEAHTDFIFAVIAEELGLIGGLLVLLVMFLLISRLFILAKRAMDQQQLFNGLVVFAIAIMFSVQTLINIGVSSGFLPTKGLTLPFISYGGSSLLISFALMALVIRIQWELSGPQQPEPVVKPSRRRLEVEA